MAILLTVLALAGALLSIVGFVHALMTEWRQTREGGPVAIIPTLPFGVFTPMAFTIALVLLGTAQPTLHLPWWAYVGLWIGSTAFAIVLLRLVSRPSREGPDSAEGGSPCI